jgi:hypothetical protein
VNTRPLQPQVLGAWISFPPPPFSLLSPLFSNFHINHSLLYCISRKNVDTEYTYYSWCMTSTDIVKWRKHEWLWKFWKRNDLYENFLSNYIIWDGSARTGTLGFLWMDYLQWKTQMRSEYFSRNILAENIKFLPEKFFVRVNSYWPWNYFSVSIFRWSLCHFYEMLEIIRLLLYFFGVFNEWNTCNEKPRCAPNIFPGIFWPKI